ncbi:hypothetical protein WOLCODRAFT_15275 [Wolfiporia cocos MD-104 SS10]|uniref:Uncharacterized protein n=1 Tax=Wolfiporia cocos (strain MD-104) TaxID=742152 RepID=A0A2H3JCE8_WOLCO|nr:hypothetical protein WOLCODRAFT_15275 [Wolfiporia cocos MD-104 SS10]
MILQALQPTLTSPNTTMQAVNIEHSAWNRTGWTIKNRTAPEADAVRTRRRAPGTRSEEARGTDTQLRARPYLYGIDRARPVKIQSQIQMKMQMQARAVHRHSPRVDPAKIRDDECKWKLHPGVMALRPQNTTCGSDAVSTGWAAGDATGITYRQFCTRTPNSSLSTRHEDHDAITQVLGMQFVKCNTARRAVRGQGTRARTSSDDHICMLSWDTTTQAVGGYQARQAVKTTTRRRNARTAGDGRGPGQVMEEAATATQSAIDHQYQDEPAIAEREARLVASARWARRRPRGEPVSGALLPAALLHLRPHPVPDGRAGMAGVRKGVGYRASWEKSADGAIGNDGVTGEPGENVAARVSIGLSGACWLIFTEAARQAPARRASAGARASGKMAGKAASRLQAQTGRHGAFGVGEGGGDEGGGRAPRMAVISGAVGTAGGNF